MENYRSRIADSMLSRKLGIMGAVLVEGPKWCGKTTTCKQFAKSIVDLSDPDERERIDRLAEMGISRFLDGDTPRLIDEWQDVPKFWDAIRHRVDQAGANGLFLLTGSAVVPEEKRRQISHSGTGRIARLKMRPMTLWESGESSGQVGLSELFAGDPVGVRDSKNLSLDEIAYAICRGGWPVAVEKGGDLALDYAREYVNSITESDISRVDGVPRAPERVRRLMRSLSRLQATQAGLAAIRRDIAANDDSSLSEQTVASYVGALEKIFVVENVHAWSPNLRDKSAVRTSETRYFADPSIAAASLGVAPADLIGDLATFGFFLETMAVRDLRTYADFSGGFVEHYHDKTGLECDAVVHWGNGDYGLVEIKLGGETLIGEGVRTLAKLDALIASKKFRPPRFRMVLTAVGEFAYARREDGIVVCPISALKP